MLCKIDVASRYKVARPLRTKQVKDLANMIADMYKVGPLIYPKLFLCNNSSEFKAEVLKMLEKNGVTDNARCNNKVEAHSQGIHRGFEQAACRKSVQGPRCPRVE